MTQGTSSSVRPNLVRVILTDLFTVGRLPLLLLFAMFVTAMGIVFTTHQARQAITEREREMIEREHLDNEWRNLLLEETALSDHSRVQDLAQKELNMIRPDADKEVVVSLK
ncbi:cell division protein FtsL [Vibrio mangrovi]|uniref:Cell division protein FtsL n=1 Tax=Vibrio mangrovi TaxID=474394 RepID=A0A1Y6IRH8_9VIBR|nr:cell division protein FtsL [Vibrio mangrovi]MDW6001745.1 cell division protein FtsL [Vibrio mangrovi]SMS00228.1 Cell division protein FtsL [Vibrio mangrovi]